jgi:hypothetical protein
MTVWNVYMDDFIVYGNTFDEEINTIRKVLEICQATNLSPSHEKFHMLLTYDMVLGHHISPRVSKLTLKKSK